MPPFISFKLHFSGWTSKLFCQFFGGTFAHFCFFFVHLHPDNLSTDERRNIIYEGGKKMLQYSNLQYTNAVKFNDPFDCHPLSLHESIRINLNNVWRRKEMKPWQIVTSWVFPLCRCIRILAVSQYNSNIIFFLDRWTNGQVDKQCYWIEKSNI